MVEKELPKMPRKIKKSKMKKSSSSKKRRSKSKSKTRGKSEDSKSQGAPSDYDLTDPGSEVENPEDKGEVVKLLVPVEDLNARQISMLNMAEKIKLPEFKIKL